MGGFPGVPKRCRADMIQGSHMLGRMKWCLSMLFFGIVGTTIISLGFVMHRVWAPNGFTGFRVAEKRVEQHGLVDRPADQDTSGA